jgi:hypothetical protein
VSGQPLPVALFDGSTPADNNGPTMFERIGVIARILRRVFNPSPRRRLHEAAFEAARFA